VEVLEKRMAQLSESSSGLKLVMELCRTEMPFAVKALAFLESKADAVWGHSLFECCNCKQSMPSIVDLTQLTSTCPHCAMVSCTCCNRPWKFHGLLEPVSLASYEEDVSTSYDCGLMNSLVDIRAAEQRFAQGDDGFARRWVLVRRFRYSTAMAAVLESLLHRLNHGQGQAELEECEDTFHASRNSVSRQLIRVLLQALDVLRTSYTACLLVTGSFASVRNEAAVWEVDSSSLEAVPDKKSVTVPDELYTAAVKLQAFSDACYPFIGDERLVSGDVSTLVLRSRLSSVQTALQQALDCLGRVST
jgi:hypothetical protein